MDTQAFHTVTVNSILKNLDKVVLLPLVGKDKSRPMTTLVKYKDTKDPENLLLQSRELSVSLSIRGMNAKYPTLVVYIDSSNKDQANFVEAVNALYGAYKESRKASDCEFEPAFNTSKVGNTYMVLYFEESSGLYKTQLDVQYASAPAARSGQPTLEQLTEALPSDKRFNAVLQIKPYFVEAKDESTRKTTARFKATVRLINVTSEGVTVQSGGEGKRRKVAIGTSDLEFDEELMLVQAGRFDADALVCTEPLPEEKSKSTRQLVAFPSYRYPNDQTDHLRVQTDWSTGENRIYLNTIEAKNDVSVVMKLKLTDVSPDQHSLVNVMRQLEEKAQVDYPKLLAEHPVFSQSLAADARKYSFNPILNEDNDSKTNLSKITAKFELDFTSEDGQLTAINTIMKVNGEEKTQAMFASGPEYLDYMAKTVATGSSRVVLALKKAWFSKSKMKGVYNFGIKFVVPIIEVVNRPAAAIGDVSLVDDVDDDAVASTTAKVVEPVPVPEPVPVQKDDGADLKVVRKKAAKK